jgi:hypothetical protein
MRTAASHANGGTVNTSHRPRAAGEPLPGSYLNSHRALAACGRELERLATAVAEGASELQLSSDDRLQVRRSPLRVIVQLGPVALTLTWLRTTPDTVESGQLLAVVWKGIVRTGAARLPEDSATPLARSATPLWEEALSAVAGREEEWGWQSLRDDTQRFSSAELAGRCIERLRVAHAEAYRARASA